MFSSLCPCLHPVNVILWSCKWKKHSSPQEGQIISLDLVKIFSAGRDESVKAWANILTYLFSISTLFA